MYVITPD